MADRYWVGGTDSWNNTAGSKWSTTSGGAGGASEPTSSDNVFFDAASGAVTVTVATSTRPCLNLDFSGFTGTLAGTVGINVFGAFTAASGMTWSHTGPITFLATSGTHSVTSNGKSFSSTFSFNGLGGAWQLADDLTNTSQVSISGGTLDTNGKTVTTPLFFTLGVQTRVVTLGASVINVSSTFAADATGLTFNANTSSVRMGPGSTVSTASLTFNDLQLNGTATSRAFLSGRTLGTASTITAASLTATYADFTDITGAGAATWSGTSLGDGLGNTNITFAAPVTRYAVASGNWSSTATWSTSSGGSSGASAPLPQDTVYVDANSGVGTITLDFLRTAASLDFTGYTGTFNAAVNLSTYGNVVLGSGMTFTGSGTINFRGRGSHSITSNGVVFPGSLQFGNAGGTYTLQDALTTTSLISHAAGTFDTNGQSVQSTSMQSSTTGTRTLTLGATTWTLTGTGTVWAANTFSLTINANSSTIKINNATATAKTFAGAGFTYNNIWFTGAGTGTFDISGSNTFNDFKVDTPPHTIRFTPGTTTTVTTFTVSGTTGNLMTIGSISASSHTLTKAGGGTISCDYLSISRSTATPGSTWYAGANSTDGGNNSGWTFTAPPGGFNVKPTMFQVL